MSTTIDDQLLEHVFKRLQEGYSDTNISKETSIHASTISKIRRGVSLRYRTDKYTWPKHSPDLRVLDKATIFSIYDDFIYTDMNNSEIARKYNVSRRHISNLRTGNRHSNLAREYINRKGLAGYWQGYRHPK
jgi:transcriptional regulator with XRE-family HTH domain